MGSLHPPGSSDHTGVGTPADAGAELHRVRVPVVFDHLNQPLRDQLLAREVEFKQAIGRGVAVMGDDSLDTGEVEIWFEMNCVPDEPSRHATAGDAVAIVERALELVGLAPTQDETGLSVVHTQVVTTQLTGPGGNDE